MKATPGGAPPPHGRSSRASAQKYPVLVLREPGSSTGARVSSMNSFVDRFTQIRADRTTWGWNSGYGEGLSHVVGTDEGCSYSSTTRLPYYTS